MKINPKTYFKCSHPTINASATRHYRSHVLIRPCSQRDETGSSAAAGVVTLLRSGAYLRCLCE